MPRGGHNRKSRRAKIIQGTFRKDRNPPREPTPPPVVAPPAPPDGMNRWARKLWKSIVNELIEQELLTTLDLASLQLTCEAYGDYEEAKQSLFYPKNPFTRKRVHRTMEQYLSGIDPWIHAKDTKKLSLMDLALMRRNSQTAPELAQRNRAWAVYKAYLTEFGLSPASRNRINLPKKKEPGQDPMEKLLSGT